MESSSFSHIMQPPPYLASPSVSASRGSCCVHNEFRAVTLNLYGTQESADRSLHEVRMLYDYIQNDKMPLHNFYSANCERQVRVNWPLKMFAKDLGGLESLAGVSLGTTILD